MTGFDPTAPARDTRDDDAESFPDNVVPPEALTEGDAPAADPEETDGS